MSFRLGGIRNRFRNYSRSVKQAGGSVETDDEGLALLSFVEAVVETETVIQRRPEEQAMKVKNSMHRLGQVLMTTDRTRAVSPAIASTPAHFPKHKELCGEIALANRAPRPRGRLGLVK